MRVKTSGRVSCLLRLILSFANILQIWSLLRSEDLQPRSKLLDIKWDEDH